MTNPETITLPREVVESLNDDQLRMVYVGRVDTGGEGNMAWSSTFVNDSRI